MIALPNGCSRSNILIIPANWKSNRAGMKKDWLIQYRFYDPAFRGTDKWGKDIPIKGMNRYKSLADRQEITAALLQQEKDMLAQGWNPILKQYVTPHESTFTADIDPSTPFIEALRLAEPRVDVVPEVHADMNSILNAVERASEVLFDKTLHQRYNKLPIGKVDSKHLIFVLEQCQKDNVRLSDKRYNRYLAYLSMIFNKLKTLKAITLNPVEVIDRKKVIKKKRKILTREQAEQIDKFWYEKDYYYWRHMHVFFHSGARGTELRQVKKGDNVDLTKQEFTVLVKKGGQYEEQVRVISKSALHLWQEVWDEAKDGQYLFGSCLRPGSKPQSPWYVRNKWYDHVQKGMGIDVTFYPLKHKHQDMIDAMRNLKLAQTAAGHKSERTAKIYAVGHEDRERDELKDLDITLTG